MKRYQINKFKHYKSLKPNYSVQITSSNIIFDDAFLTSQPLRKESHCQAAACQKSMRTISVKANPFLERYTVLPNERLLKMLLFKNKGTKKNLAFTKFCPTLNCCRMVWRQLAKIDPSSISPAELLWYSGLVALAPYLHCT